MNHIFVWEIPTRQHYWAFTALLTVAIAIGFFTDDQQLHFPQHMIFGVVAMFLLVARLSFR